MIERKRFENGELKTRPQCYYICECDCGHIISAQASWLSMGNTKSCGYCGKDEKSDYTKKENKYEVFDDYGICYMNNSEDCCHFDIDDYESLKGHSWSKNANGYAEARINNKTVLMHRYVLKEIENGKVVDHANKNKLDNRKSNLRITTKSKNGMNRSGVPANNRTGIIGIFKTKNNTYRTYITYEGVRIELGRYADIEQAIRVRLNAKNKYFKEFAPQKHLFKKYGIEVERENS